MEIGLLVRYGKLVPGREEQGIELFEETMRYCSSKLADGTLTYFEPFFLATSDLGEESGFFIMRGPAPSIFGLMEEEEYHRLMQKGAMLCEHMRADLLTVGEGIQVELERIAKVRAELGI
jgi:hypothetical protein